MTVTNQWALPHPLTCIWRLASVPDENASVVRWAGKHVIIDRADGQTVHGIDVQEHVQGFSSAETTNVWCKCKYISRQFHHWTDETFFTMTVRLDAEVMSKIWPTSLHHEESPVRHFLKHIKQTNWGWQSEGAQTFRSHLQTLSWDAKPARPSGAFLNGVGS